MLSYTEVDNAEPESLTALATAWSGVADTHSDAAKALNTQATEKLWGGSLAGHSIRAAQGRSEQLRTQIKAGATESDDIAATVKAFANTIARLQGELATVVSEAGHAGLDVSEAGVVSVPAATLTLLRDSGHLDLQATALNSAGKFNARIEEVLENATKADAEFKQNLRLVAELGSRGDKSFNTDSDKDIAAFADAERAADLLRGGKDHLVSEKELALANRIMARHNGNDVFATELMNDLGPDALLRQSGSIAAAIGYDNDLGNDERVEELYRNLGATLATATDDANGYHVDEEWIEDFRAAGAREYTVNATGLKVPGYTLISPAFTSGSYDPDFIAPVTAHMMVLDGGTDWKADWNPILEKDGPPGVYQNLGPVQQSPINAALIAIDNNPAAATELFSHGPGDEYTFDNAEGQAVHIDPLDYVLRTAEDPGRDVGIDANIAGNAIEAAATGVSSDDAPGASRPSHSDQMVDITERLMDYANDHTHEFTGSDASKKTMVDSFGDITANYIEDFHSASMDDGYDYVKLSDAESHLDLGGHDSLTPQQRMNDWLHFIGHSQSASATVMGASTGLMELETMALGDLAGVDTGDFNQVAEMHGRVGSQLKAGEFDATHDKAFAAAEDKNAVLDAFKKGLTVSAGLGISATPLGPAGGAAAGEVTNLGLDQIFGHWQDSDDEVWDRIAKKDAEELANLEKELEGEPARRIESLVRQAAPDMDERHVTIAVDNYKDRILDTLVNVARRP